MNFGELLIRNGYSDKTINVKPGDILYTEDGRLLEVVQDLGYPCKGKCALSDSNRKIHLMGGGYICCATFGCMSLDHDDIHIELKGGEECK